MALDVYRATQRFPSDERFGLTSQMRRASISVSANIAEGCGRSGERDLARFLRIATGSASELECELLLSRDLHLLDEQIAADLLSRTEEIKRMLTSLIRKVTPSDRTTEN